MAAIMAATKMDGGAFFRFFSPLLIPAAPSRQVLCLRAHCASGPTTCLVRALPCFTFCLFPRPTSFPFSTQIDAGWQPRWFVFSDGVLSYYLSQDDVRRGCKGSINLGAAEVRG